MRNLPVLILLGFLAHAGCMNRCKQSIEAYCADPWARCARNWSDWDAPSGAACRAWNSGSGVCGDYSVGVTSGVDSSMSYYYDRKTGGLVAVVASGVFSSECVAGVTDTFEVPSCPHDFQPVTCDGGADAAR